ncbi:MAG: hypothetical protein QNK37_29980 [Acidobacteriota bacterium]|nr:hypothetical protein [Acidobacteriota bacterium]
MTQQVFRKQALAHMSSPEQLDQVIVVTSPAGWLSLAGLGLLLAGVLLWGFFGSVPTTIQGSGILLTPEGIGAVRMPLAGSIRKVLVEPDQQVAAGETIAIIGSDAGSEDMPLKASHPGRVLELLVRQNDRLAKDAPLMTMELGMDTEDKLRALVYLPPALGQAVQRKMTMRILPEAVQAEKYGFLLADVTEISPFPVSRQGMLRTLGNRALVEHFSRFGAPIAVIAELQTDNNTAGGYRWTSRNGFPGRIASGTICRAEVITRRQSPISLVMPFFDFGDR